ncbi:sensor histidine kinase [Bacillus sp. V3B]|uniref:sensor histidine kinase n=1 Tax=Bacillus sp. V3B TaxID=2804915 RepID=UPI002109CD4E|nr:ATP-binding protein [Bacillus sp. V3B]MCQ6274366.1 sensor histidine kinase [Bacillus sp. V3B]
MEKRPENYISSYIIQTQEEEIKRIALELHEGVGQTLYSLFTGLQMIENSIEKPAIKSYVKEMAQGLEKTIQEIRLLSVELHPPTLATLGLVPAIKSYVKLYMSTFGIVVNMESFGKETLISEHQSIALFRVCQEALANIAKYADTCEASIIFIWGDHDLQMLIEDGGKGFDYDEQWKQSSGLAAMKERMYLVGGTCRVSSTMGEGTMIRVSLPLKIV